MHYLPLLLGILAAAGTQVACAAESAVTSNIEDVASRSWDFIVLGGGFAGLTVANRLTETNASILVVEAGQDIRLSDLVVYVESYGKAFNTDLNWAFPMTDRFGKKRSLRAGRGLGGSTSINGAAWTRAAKEQYDAIEQLGNPGWNWKSLLGYMKKSERFIEPTEDQRKLGAGYDASVHGMSGPLQISYTLKGLNFLKSRKRMYTDAYGDNFFYAASSAVGLRRVVDITSDDVHGSGATTPNSILPFSTSRVRISAATAYLSYIEFDRPNLKVLIGWRGVKVICDTADPLKVVGVVLQQSASGPLRNVEANKAVIVAMGCVNTPGFLERSGIGDPAILTPLGISTKVDLAGVGRNLQDQTINSISYKNSTPFIGQGPGSHIAFPSVDNLFSNASALRKDLNSKFDEYAEQVVAEGGAVSTNAVQAQWSLMVSNIWDKKVSVAEHFLDHGFPDGGLGQDVWQLTVFSRGKVHINSTSSFDDPILDPAYFQIPLDLEIKVAAMRAARKIFGTTPLKETLGGELVPGTKAVPMDTNFGSYPSWSDRILQGFSGVAHQIGTSQMAPRSLGGVVNPSGAVYGVSKGSLRVVDASTLPFQFSGHLSASLHGMAEKFSDIIKKEFAL